MAIMGRILDNVREDMIKRVYSIDPAIYPAVGWNAYESHDPKDETQGHSRSFTVYTVSSRGVTFGSTSNDFEVIYDLSITYELGQQWTDAATDDHEGIVSAFQRQWTLGTIPTGLDYYIVGDLVLSTGENFQTATIPITARIVADVRS